MNLSQAQAEIANRGFDYLDATRTLFHLNQAKNIFEDVYPWPWLEVLVTGTSPLTISDLKYVLYVRDATTGTELLGMPAQQLVVAGVDIAGLGSPWNWWLDGTNVVTAWPVNTATSLEVRYVKESPELVAATDTPLIPARYHSTWIDLAVIRAYIDSDNYAAAMALKSMTEDDLVQIVNRYATRNRQNAEYQTLRAGADDW